MMDSDIFDLLENLTDENEDLEYYEILENLIHDKIDINNASERDLLQIPFLTQHDAKEILKTRKILKEYSSSNDFQFIKNVNPDLILLLKLFVKIISKENARTSHSLIFRSRILNELQERKGFTDNKFIGNKLKTYNKLKAKLNDFSTGIIIEKDAGETSYADHYSGYFSFMGNGLLKHIIAGDYTVEFGQGLTLWSPYSISKNAEVSNNIKKQRFIIPHLSADENNFLRGIAFHSNLNFLELGAFYSYNKIDASLDNMGNISSILQSGYHRTENEINNFNNVNLQNYGAFLSYNLNSNISLDFLHFGNIFENNIVMKNRPYLNGKKFSYSAVSYNLFFNVLNVAGEISKFENAAAFINNIYFNFSKALQLSVSYRNYNKEYFSFFASGFGENSNTNSEKGFYFGIKSNTEFGKVNFYYDIFSFPFSNNLIGFNSTGDDVLLTLERKIFSALKVNFKLKIENKEMLFENNYKENIGQYSKTNCRLSFEYNVSKTIYGRSRIELMQYKEFSNKENGFLIYQDVKLKLDEKLFLSSRYIFFQTDSYNSRIYEFENDLSGVFSNNALFGEGFRFYFLIQYKIFHNVNLSIKYSDTFKPNETSLGSSYSEIIGNVDNKLSLQFDLTL